MLNIFKYIDYALKAKKGVQKPDELLTDLSFGIVEGYFILSFVVLGVFTIGSFWGGFIKDIVFLKITFFFFLTIFVVVFIIFKMLKSLVARVSQNVTSRVKKEIGKNKIIDIKLNK